MIIGNETLLKTTKTNDTHTVMAKNIKYILDYFPPKLDDINNNFFFLLKKNNFDIITHSFLSHKQTSGHLLGLIWKDHDYHT